MESPQHCLGRVSACLMLAAEVLLTTMGRQLRVLA